MTSTPPRTFDANAARLSVLREFLSQGLSLKEAVAATNKYFRELAAKAQAERAA